MSLLAICSLALGALYALSLLSVQQQISWKEMDRGEELRVLLSANTFGWALAAGAFLVGVGVACLPSAWTNALRSRLHAGNIVVAGFLILAGLTLVWMQHSTAARRVVFAMLFAASLWEFSAELRSLFRHAWQTHHGRIAAMLISLFVVTKLVPGIHFYPFTPGIAGWKFRAVESDDVVISGLQILRDDGEATWFSYDLVLPQAFGFRQFLHCEKDPDRLRPLLHYYFDLFSEHYPDFARGHYHHQRFLGAWAFPPHMPGRFMDYASFPPERIVGFRYVVEIHSKSTGQRKELRVNWVFRLADDSLSKS